MFLKEISDEIAEPLTVLYNESLRAGVIPLEWKKSPITPVQKGGSTDDATNYRPIAVLSVVVKVLELLNCPHIWRVLHSYILTRQHTGLEVY